MQDTSPLSIAPTQPSPPPPQATTPKKLPWIIALVLGIALIALLGVAFLNKDAAPDKSASSQKDEHVATKMTVYNKLFIQACSVVKEKELEATFGLTGNRATTISQDGPLPLKSPRGSVELTTLVPDTLQFFSECAYVKEKPATGLAYRFEARIMHTKDQKTAATLYENSKPFSARDRLSSLPSFPQSYIVPPAVDTIFKGRVLLDNKTIDITYQFGAPDTQATVLPLVDQYVRQIVNNIQQAKETGTFLSSTKRKSFVGGTFVDACTALDPQDIAKLFPGMQLRPDNFTASATPASLPGSLAAKEGAKSFCNLTFNTEQDRKALASAHKASATYRWPHKLRYSLNSFASPAAASSWYEEKKAVSSRNATLQVDDVTGIGTAAYRLGRTSDVNATGEQGKGTVFREVELSVLKGRNVILVSISQSAEDFAFQATPMEIKDEQLKKAANLIAEELN